jgi:hypothetical protein
MKYSSTPPKHVFALWFSFLSILAGVVAYYKMFTGFVFFDDEGTLMITVRQYLAGMKLYNQIVLPYGPVYYFYNWALRTLTGTPVTHDVVRMSSLIPWLLTALISAWIVYRLTGSLVLASFTHLLTSIILSLFFHNEPGHPQELCILLLVCLVACGIVISIPRWRLLGMISLGALTSALLLVKVNIGAFVFLAASLALLAHSPKTKLSRLAFSAVGAVCVIFPAILMKSHLEDGPTRLYAVLVSVSMMAVLLVLFRVPRPRCFLFSDCWIALASFTVTSVGVILVVKAQGVALYSMLHALVLDSLTMYVKQHSWFLSLPVRLTWTPWIVGGLVAAAFASWNPAERYRTEDKLPYLKLGLVVIILTAALLLFKVAPFELVAPFCWLVLYRPESGSESYAFPRTLLCVVTVLQMLYAYPIAGSQKLFFLVLPIIVLMVCFGDFVVWQQQRLPVIPRAPIRAATAVLLLGVAATYLVIAGNERKYYDSLPSLQLRGAGRIHLQHAQAEDYHWLARSIDDYCDVFVGVPELPSLHIWTGKDPLPGMEIDDWMLTASNQQQIAVSAILSEHPNACAIYNQDLVDFWDRDHRNLDSLPLVHYLRANFKVVGATGQFSLLVRDQRNLTVVSAP